MSFLRSGCACLRCQIERNVNRTNPDVKEFFRDATLEQLEGLVENIVKACPNLFIVARGLRAALRDDWERAEVAELLMEGVNE